MVEALRNIEVASSMLAAGGGPAPSLAATYVKLGCQLKPVDDSAQMQVFCTLPHSPTRTYGTVGATSELL